MRRSAQTSDKRNGGKRSILNNAAYSIFTHQSSVSTRNVGFPGGGLGGVGGGGGGGATGSIVNNVSNNSSGSSASSRRLNYSVRENSTGGGCPSSFLQRSVSADNVVVRQRGFKPSDRHDPAKRHFLENLTSKILHFDMESGNSTPINLQKLLTPASDSNELLHVKNKKMYASSYFYAPTHPTVEDQVELARRISSSLSDVKNVKSKGQSMYVNRKKRSVKWIHDGNGAEDEEEPSSPVRKEKVPLKCMMNPSGKLLDIQGIQALGEEVNISTTPPHPERLFDIVRDLNNQKGRGAEIFAKRRKRSEKWVVDTEQPQSPSSYCYGKAPTYPMKQQEVVANENLTFENKPFYNPFTVDISMDYSTPPTSCAHQHQRQCSRASFSSAHSDCGPCHTEVKKIYLREIAVGTEPEISNSRENKIADKSRRLSFDGSSKRSNNSYGCNQRSCNSSVSNSYSRGSRSKTNQNGNHYHQYQSNNHQFHQPRSNGYQNHHHNHYNGYSHNGHHISNGYSYHQPPHYSSHQTNGFHNSNGYQNSNGYPNSNGYQNSNDYQHNNDLNGYQNGNGYQNCNSYENSNGYHNNNANGYSQPQSNGNIDEVEEIPEEDYTPVPVKQLIQEFEKTCRPVMQVKQYTPKAPPLNSDQGDISRFFESRREVIYHNRRAADDNHRHQHQMPHSYQQQQQRNQYRNNNCYASSGDDEHDDEDEDDDDASLDDSLSPVEFYRVDDHRLLSHMSNSVAGNRSSSMSTLDEYYRRQLQYQTSEQPEDEPNGKKYTDSEAEVPPVSRVASLAAVASQDEIIKQRKHLKNTTVLENLVAGTTTPECFKKEFTEDVAGKLYDNGYQGPKITSYQNLTNYNTAPRGWDQTQPIYRPIKFEKPQDNKIAYSDF